MLRQFGVGRIFRSKDFKYAMALAIMLSAIGEYFSISREIVSNFSLILVTVATALVAVIITGLAIIVSTSDDNFIKICNKAGIYANLLFPFWYSAVISGLAMLFNSISYIVTLIVKENAPIVLQSYELNNHVFTIFLFLSFFFIFYALFSVIALVENAIKYGLYRGTFLENS